MRSSVPSIRNQRQGVPSKSNVVIGAARGYSFEQLRPFFLSLRRTGFAGDSVLLWSELSAETRSSLEQSGVKLVPIGYTGNGAENPWSRAWPIIRPLTAAPIGPRLRCWLFKRLLNIATSRFIHALDFLEANIDRYCNVLLSDVRDVIFQDNPFREAQNHPLIAFLEAPHVKFGEEPKCNDAWIRNNYGSARLERLKGYRISCCGTVMGEISSVISYLRNFVGEIQNLKSLAWGADTSIHNVLVRDVMKSQFYVAENFVDVATIGNVLREDIRHNPAGLITGPDGRPVPIIHQCPPERVPSLCGALGIV